MWLSPEVQIMLRSPLKKIKGHAHQLNPFEYAQTSSTATGFG
jgi:hypothetical protein